MNNNNNDRLYLFLQEIQLESFWSLLRDKLQITQISHFDYVKPKDLEKIGMSKPAIRRLLDSVNKNKKSQYKPRPAPAPPVQTTSSSANQNNFQQINNFSRLISSNKILSSFMQKNLKPNSDKNESQSVSFIINPFDIKILKLSDNKDDILGTGHFGVVKKAIWNSPNGSKLTVAVKCLHDDYIESNAEDKQQAFLDIVNEISCMCGLDHKNLIKLYGVVLNGSSNGNGMIMMVTELAIFGSLQNHLRKHREHKKLPINKLYSYIYQISDGMEYLENKKLIHRDLAARNILLFTIDHVKICDFGMTKSAQNGSYTMIESHKIPCAWYPPESIREKLFSIKSDVWAFGVTMWEIFSFCEQPWPNMSASEILTKLDIENKRLSIPYLCSKNFYNNIILICWSKNPIDRPSFKILKSLIKDTKIIEMKAKNDFKEDNRLDIEKGDVITIIDGDAVKYWWKGQNMRTLLSGSFPRAILDTQRRLNGEDISLPLKNSFIHTGHMGIGKSDKQWGNPGKIDDIFLKNPLNPPDFLGQETENENLVAKNGEKELNSNLNDLIDLFGASNEIKISYPDCSTSLNSFGSNKSEGAVSLSSQSSQVYNQAKLYVNDQYVPNKPQILEERTYYNNLPSYKPHEEQIDSYYNNDVRNFNQQSTISQEISEFVFKTDTIVSANVNPQFQPLNPFDNINKNLKLNTSPTNKKLEFNPKFTNNDFNKKLNVDDLLNKVMNDVLNDFKNVKLNQK